MSVAANQSDLEQAQRFLSALFTPDDLIEFRPIETWDDNGEKKRRLVGRRYARLSETAQSFAWLQSINHEEHANAFFGVNPRPHDRAGKSADIRVVRVLSADLDDCTTDAAMHRVHEAEIPEPSIVVNSGHGTHLYWVLSDSVSIESDADRERVEGTTQRLQKLLGGDHTQDLARILRVPGLPNVKNAANGVQPATCELVRCEPERQYSFDELVEYLPSEPKSTPPKSKGSESAKLKPSDQHLIELVRRGLDTLPVGERSEADISALLFAQRCGLDQAQAWSMFGGVSKFADRGESYFRRTWAKAAEAHAKSNRKHERNGHADALVPVWRTMTDVTSRPVRWAWPRHIPLRGISLMTGRMGEGKSVAACAFAAAVSSGSGWPDSPHEPQEVGDVVMVVAEDDLETVIRPRLEAAGAALERIHVLTMMHSPEDDRSFLFHVERDAPALREFIQDNGNVKLVIIDPLGVFMGRVDTHRHSDTYSALAPLSTLAQETDVAVLGIHHHSKAKEADASRSTWNKKLRSSSGWPDSPHEPQEVGDVVMVVAEDDLETVIRPRLEAAGAALERIHVLTMMHSPEDDRSFLFHVERDAPALREFIQDNGNVKLVIIDPLGVFMGRVDTHRHSDTYSALAPLSTLAQETDVAVLGIHHHSKAKEADALSRIMGSSAYAAISRAAFGVFPDPDDATRRYRILACAKLNHCEWPPALRFKIESADNGAGVAVWDSEPVEGTADDIIDRLNSQQREQRSEGSSLGEAMDWLKSALAHGAVPARELDDQAKAVGISKSTLDRAKAKVGVEAVPERDDRNRVQRWIVALRGENGLYDDQSPNNIQ